MACGSLKFGRMMSVGIVGALERSLSNRSLSRCDVLAEGN